MGRFKFWRNVGALALMGTMTYAEDQVVRDRNGDPWIISIRPGSRLAGLPLPGATRSVPAPSEPLPPSFDSPGSTIEPSLPDPLPPTPGRRARTSTSAPVDLPTVAVDAPKPSDPPAPAKPVPSPPPAAPPLPALPEKAPTPATPPASTLTLPAPEMPSAPSSPEDGEHPVIVPGRSSACVPRINGRTYEEVYQSIPYRYTEYLANPSYRHEAAMEILFNQLRPTTIHKEYTPQVVPDPVAAASPIRPFLFAHPEQWIYRYTDYRYQWYLTPQLSAPYGVF